MTFKKIDPAERFARFFTPGDPSDCWEWRGCKTADGYGRFWNGVRETGAHRHALEMSGVDLPGDKMACHHCDNPPCVNPDHLFVGTVQDNADDRHSKLRGRYYALRCKRGHPFSTANTYFWTSKAGKTSRVCRACSRLRARNCKMRRRA